MQLGDRGFGDSAGGRLSSFSFLQLSKCDKAIAQRDELRPPPKGLGRMAERNSRGMGTGALG